MKVSELFEATLSGAEKAAAKLGKAGGEVGKPMLSKIQVQKTFGDGMWKIYSDAYTDAKNAYQSKEDALAWKEKMTDKRQGRNYHE